MIRLLELFEKAKTTPSDINQHLDTLRDYAKQCEHVTEFGTRKGISTVALMMGAGKTVITYDVEEHPEIKELLMQAEINYLEMKYAIVDVLKIEIEETDLLFIDTFHVYGQLKQELKLHAGKVRKFIIMHDTESYRNRGEGEEWWISKEMKSNYGGDNRGLQPAIDEFLQQNSKWKLEKHFTNNNGLTILKREN